MHFQNASIKLIYKIFKTKINKINKNSKSTTVYLKNDEHQKYRVYIKIYNSKKKLVQ